MFKVTTCLVIVLTIGFGQYLRPDQKEQNNVRLAPKLLNYQGFMTDTLNNPINDSLDILFRIYDAPSGGNLIWSENQIEVSILKGIFHVLLGTVTPIPDSVFTKSTDRWLELRISSQNLLPRTRFTASPYAYISDYADTATYARNAGSDNDWTRATGKVYTYNLTDTVGIRTTAPRYALDVNGVICGGVNDTVLGAYGAVLGGYHNVAGDAAVDTGAVVAGGYNNTARSKFSFVGGGNTNAATNPLTTVTGGYNNTAQGTNSTVTGGSYNLAYGDISVVAGGYGNRDSSLCGTISGGHYNMIRSAADHSAIAGGLENQAHANYASIGGGNLNVVVSSSGTISGGESNIACGFASVAGGGFDNTAGYDITDTSCMVGGGGYNLADGYYATVGGGRKNYAWGNKTTVCGGDSNRATGNYSGIQGGYHNQASGSASVVTGGYVNIASNSYAAVHGGYYNTASADMTFIGGGDTNVNSGSAGVVCGGRNNVNNGSRGFIGGGYTNTVNNSYTVCAGGYGNRANGYESTIGGGDSNITGDNDTIQGGSYSTIPGGYLNQTRGGYSFAAGYRAKADSTGSFVWGDSYNGDVRSPHSNSVAFRSIGGYYIYTNGGLTAGVYVPAGGSSWSSVSDRNLKDNFQPVNGREVLNKLAQMPITTWNYKSQDQSIRHIGPMAQDFAAFGVGEDDKHITTIDADGIALVAIQELYKQNQELKKEIEALKQELKKR